MQRTRGEDPLMALVKLRAIRAELDLSVEQLEQLRPKICSRNPMSHHSVRTTTVLQNESRSPWISRLLAAILLVLVFFTGGLLGIAGDRVLLLHEGRILPKEGMQIVSSRIVRAMDRELDLTDAQKAEIERILDLRKERIGEIWSTVSPSVREETDRSNAEIADQLTPEQREKFAKILERRERRIERMTGRRSP